MVSLFSRSASFKIDKKRGSLELLTGKELSALINTLTMTEKPFLFSWLRAKSIIA